MLAPTEAWLASGSPVTPACRRRPCHPAHPVLTAPRGLRASRQRYHCWGPSVVSSQFPSPPLCWGPGGPPDQQDAAHEAWSRGLFANRGVWSPRRAEAPGRQAWCHLLSGWTLCCCLPHHSPDLGHMPEMSPHTSQPRSPGGCAGTTTESRSTSTIFPRGPGSQEGLGIWV